MSDHAVVTGPPLFDRRAFAAAWGLVLAYGVICLGLGIVLSTAYFSGNQVVVQRALGARSEWDAKAGVLFAALFKLFIPVLVAVPGLCALVIVPGLENPDDAVPSLIRMLLPTGLRGLMFAAFLAALMSSVDSALNSASTLWTEDVIAKYRRARAETSAAFSWNAYGVSSSSPRGGGVSRAASRRCTVTIVGLVSPDPMSTSTPVA